MAKILIVDDSKFMRRIIRETLEEGGHKIIAEADNGFDGVECFRAYKPEVITMDITMGGKDGIKAAMEIQQIDPEAKIIVISALNEKTINVRSINIMIWAYITKPFEKKELLDAVNNIL